MVSVQHEPTTRYWSAYRTDSFGAGVVICDPAGRITGVSLPQVGHDEKCISLPKHVEGGPAERVARILERVFSEGLDVTGLPVVVPTAPAFRFRVWLACIGIPRGETRDYGWLAEQAGSPGAARAAGSAMAKNPIPLVIPCHRVVQKDGRLGSYGGGVEMKRHLLQLEGAAALR